ncbi:MAG: hypothetical protein K0V04_38725 [Deltaproteobacteria bacterium]|nr:hypothetical protein [Deltaproteobacteria bacterium]
MGHRRASHDDLRTRLSLTLWAIAATLTGCSDEPALPPVAWESDVLRVRVEDPTTVICEGSFEAIERHATLVRDVLALDGRDRILDYSVVEPDSIGQWCSSTSTACTHSPPGQVFTATPVLLHEVTHAVRILNPDTRLLSPALEEGMAVLYGDEVFRAQTPPLMAESLLQEQIVTVDQYLRTGLLTNILVQRHGLDDFMRFDRLAATTPEDEAFAEVFGETKDQFAQAADDHEACAPQQWREPLLECDDAPVMPDPATGRIVLTGNLSCGDPQVVGPTFSWMTTTRHFRVLESHSSPGHRVDVPRGTTVELVGCQAGCPERYYYDYFAGPVRGYFPTLEPGDYVVRLTRPVADDAGPFTLEL